MTSTAARQLRTSATKSYDKSKHRLLVIGGNGFVGSNILQRAVQKGIEVRSLNKSGKPKWQDVPWIDQVEWHQGDVFNPDDVAKAAEGVTGVSKYSDGVTMMLAWCVNMELTSVIFLLCSFNGWHVRQQRVHGENVRRCDHCRCTGRAASR